MKSKTTTDFWRSYNSLPEDVQKQAKQTYRLFKANPFHPSLQFKQISRRKPLYSVRIGLGYRAVGLRVNKELVVWDWIGTHTEYDKRIKLLS